MKNKHRNALFALGSFMIIAGDAHAYLDPGTGSAILQGVLAALAALVVTAKLYWHRLLRLFGIGKKKNSDHQPNMSNDSKKDNSNDLK